MPSLEAEQICGEWPCTDDEYHSECDCFGKSMLDVFRDSPRRFHALFVAQTMARPEPTPAMEFGKLFHRYVLEYDRFEREHFILPEIAPDGTPWDRRKKDHKEAWSEIEANPLTAVPVATYQLLYDMTFAIQNNEQAARLLFGDDGPVEQSIRWTDHDTSLPLKCRRDKVCRGGELIVDLKTCRDVSPQQFSKDAANFLYHCQAAHYIDGHIEVCGSAPLGFLFVAVSKEPPHSVAIYELDQNAISLGRAINQKTLADLARCFESNEWCDPWEKQINTISLPKWTEYIDRWHIE